ncbi:YolD-like family protein [Bacillus massiliglaciei]|uniref:YolD-like family protein n=1 Tax=Bacillus massiliglaciei TaxID=1816693 RepID=UPI000B182C42|nr:YolD-like family protein [Bacillus massiliglaciei]
MINKLTPGSNMKWESSRMMLPEHVAALRQLKEENKKVEKPILDEQELQEIGIVVMDSLYYAQLIRVTTWKDGHFTSHEGVVSKVDYYMKYLRLELEEDFERIMIEDITSVEQL